MRTPLHQRRGGVRFTEVGGSSRTAQLPTIVHSVQHDWAEWAHRDILDHEDEGIHPPESGDTWCTDKLRQAEMENRDFHETVGRLLARATPKDLERAGQAPEP